MRFQLPKRLLSLLLIIFFIAWGTACGMNDMDTASGYNGGDYAGAEAGTPSEPGGDGEEQEEIPPGQLTAGEWRDLDHWEFWQNLFEAPDPQDPDSISLWSQYEALWGTYTHERFAVSVVSSGDPVIDAEVVLLDESDDPVWTGRTDNRGRVELFNGYFGDAASGPFSIRATSGASQNILEDVESAQSDSLEISLESATAPAHKVDLMFMIDTTGSMGDELRYIQAELGDVLTRANDEVGASMDLRLSVNFYRDHGDDYLVRSFPFTDDYAQAISDLQAQSAAGGGDYPEAVDMAMENAIFEHQWSGDATARLLFIVLDAPPHENQESIDRLHIAIEEMAAQGVRVIPLMGSGYDKSTEYLMRSFAIATGGTFTFLTDHSGIGDSHMEPTTGDYKVEFLNDLLVRVIESYSALN